MADDFQYKINDKWKNKCITLLKNFQKNLPDTDSGNNCEREQLMKNKQELESNLSKIQEEIDALQKLLLELDFSLNDKTSVRSEFGLYELITKLKWDLNSPENHLIGFVAGNSLETFDLDLTKYSQQEVVDYLWKLIDPGS